MNKRGPDSLSLAPDTKLDVPRICGFALSRRNIRHTPLAIETLPGVFRVLAPHLGPHLLQTLNPEPEDLSPLVMVKPR